MAPRKPHMASFDLFWRLVALAHAEPKQSGTNLARPIWHQSGFQTNMAFHPKSRPIWQAPIWQNVFTQCASNLSQILLQNQSGIKANLASQPIWQSGEPVKSTTARSIAVKRIRRYRTNLDYDAIGQGRDNLETMPIWNWNPIGKTTQSGKSH